MPWAFLPFAVGIDSMKQNNTKNYSMNSQGAQSERIQNFPQFRHDKRKKPLYNGAEKKNAGFAAGSEDGK
jgi:hypothetical protein